MVENDRIKGKKTSIPVYGDTLMELDGKREVYSDGSKESWDYFLRRIIRGVSK